MSQSHMSLYSLARIGLTLGPGLGFLILLHSSTLHKRPDVLDKENRVKDTPIHEIQESYDFIIVGGGSAGAVLANRLSENPDWNILLLEAGPDEFTVTDMPLLFPAIQLSPLDWKFRTEPSENFCLSMKGGKCNWPRARVLGGCSVMNAMLYVRGNKKDYDYWRDAGNPGWGYEDVLPYFRKSEDMRIPEYMDDFYHGTGGYLSVILWVELFRYRSPVLDWFLEAAEELGYRIGDINGHTQTGFTMSHGTLRDGLRCSTAKAFLRPIRDRQNLHISLHTMVEKVLISEDGSAYGVVLDKFGTKKSVYSDYEVILSAGAIQTPQLLMISGIGDENHLEDVGISPIVKHLPGVGKNLQDHAAMGGLTYLFDSPEDDRYPQGLGFMLNKVFSTETVDEFVNHYNGPVYWLPEAEGMGFVNTKYANASEDFPDIQLFFASYADNTDGGVFSKRAAGLTDEFYTAVYEEIVYKDALNVIPLLLRPRSRGYLLLKDKNIKTHPLIYPNYFSDPYDLEVMIEGAKISNALMETKAMRRYNTRINSLKIPGCHEFDLMTDEYLRCQAKHYTLTIYHPSGTCKMGPEDDYGAVVDHRLRVYGIRNLRVVDASIMPYIVSGNTNAPTIMIAEKASDMIKEDWGYLDNGEYRQSKAKTSKTEIKKSDSDIF